VNKVSVRAEREIERSEIVLQEETMADTNGNDDFVNVKVEGEKEEKSDGYMQIKLAPEELRQMQHDLKDFDESRIPEFSQQFAEELRVLRQAIATTDANSGTMRLPVKVYETLQQLGRIVRR